MSQDKEQDQVLKEEEEAVGEQREDGAKMGGHTNHKGRRKKGE